MKLNTVELEKLLTKYNKGSYYPLERDLLIYSCERYIKAIKEGRMLCSIGSVSSSGMSRTIKFVELSKGDKNNHHVLNFWVLFKVLGYQSVKDSDYFRVHGCGMDMVFATNYNIIQELTSLGFLNKKQCAELAQKTPHII
jgi:hypothetical protein